MIWLVQYALPFFIVLIALETRSLTMLGAISGFLMAYVILLTQNVFWFLILLVFFFIGSLVTRFKEERKKKQKLLQKVRGSKNIIANGGIAMLMAILGGTVGLYGFVGAISTAAADTSSSEIGVLSRKRPRLITNFKKVQTGAEGGVSLLGTFAAFIAAFFIGIVSLMIMFDIKIILVATIAGFLGQIMDSYIGALFEKGEWFGNSMTNFFATTFGAIFGMILGVVL